MVNELKGKNENVSCIENVVSLLESLHEKIENSTNNEGDLKILFTWFTALVTGLTQIDAGLNQLNYFYSTFYGSMASDRAVMHFS